MLKSACRTERYLIQRHPGRRGVRCPSTPGSTKRQYTRGREAQHQIACRRRHNSTLDKVTVGTHHLSAPYRRWKIRKMWRSCLFTTSAFLQRRPLMWRCPNCYGAQSFGSRTSVLALFSSVWVRVGFLPRCAAESV